MTRTPIHEAGNSIATGSPGPTGRTLSEGDLASIGAVIGKALAAAVRETQSRTPAPPPRVAGDSDDPFTARSDRLLGNHARMGVRSYSLADLAKNPDGLDVLFSGRNYG